MVSEELEEHRWTSNRITSQNCPVNPTRNGSKERNGEFWNDPVRAGILNLLRCCEVIK